MPSSATAWPEKKEISEAVKRLCASLDGVRRGETIPWETIERVMGRARTDPGGWHIVNRWRRWMQRERNIVMHPNPSVGLSVLTHSETVMKRGAWRVAKARRQVHWGLREMETVSPQALSDHERRALAIRHARFKDERRRLSAAQREARSAAAPSPSAHELRVSAHHKT